MPNSDHKITRNDVVRRALRKLGNKFPSTTDISDAVQTLNDAVKELDGEGRWLWATTVDETELILIPGQRTYVAAATPNANQIPNDILDIEERSLFLLRGDNYVPLKKITHRERVSSFLRENQNEPVEWYLHRKADSADNEISFLQTPNAAYTIRFTYRRRLFDFDNPDDNPDFPPEWNLALIAKLASELSDEYGLSLPERQLLEAKARNKILAMKGRASERPAPVTTKSEYF